MTTMQQRIETKLQAAFTPSTLEVIDESALHAGHAGARPGGETHYRVRMTSVALKGLNRVAQHRAVYDTLADELTERVHALALEVVADPS